MMIALLSYSTSWSKNDWHISSTGGVNDSVYISIEDLKVANAKMVELKREKQINAELKKVVSNDSVIINSLREDIYAIENIHREKEKNIKKERNVFIGTTIGTVILLIISIL